MKATILLLSVDEAPMLAHSLPGAVAAARGAEVVVLDNGSTDSTPELAARHGARHLRLPMRHSYAAAINAGLAQTDGEAVLLLNADCFLEPGFLEAALPRLGDPAVGSVAPKLLRSSAPPASAAPAEIDAAGMVIDRRRKNGLVGHAAPADHFSRHAPAFGADGAAALYRRATLEDCALPGGQVLDEAMELWGSDADLAWRAQLYGWRCVYEPRAVARHIRTYSPSTRARLSAAHRRLQFRNRYLMMIKNDSLRELLRDAPVVLLYEVLALGFALLREPELLRGYLEAAQRLPGALRQRRVIQARRRAARVPFGLAPPE